MMNTLQKTLTTLLLGSGLLLGGTLADELAEQAPMAQKIPGLQYMGWYMRTVATATLPDGRAFTHQSAGVFGELKKAKYAKDRYDIPSLGTGILQVLFVPAWEQEEKTYFSDYRRLKKKTTHRARVWTFQVRNQKTVDLSDAELKITVEGPTDAYWGKEGIVEKPSQNTRLLKRLKLVDVDKHRVYRATRLENITLSMEGKHTRTFRWVIGKVRKQDFKPLPQTQKPPTFQPALETQARQNGKFGLPPSL
jgi:hypothetical protein